MKKMWDGEENPHMNYVMYLEHNARDNPKSSSTSGSGNTKPVRMGIYVDMDANFVVFFRQDEGFQPSKGIKMLYVPNDVKIAIKHPKHGLTATLSKAKESDMNSALENFIAQTQVLKHKCSYLLQDCPHRPCETHFPNYKKEAPKMQDP